MSHLRGVAAIMQRCGPYAFRDGVPHLLFVGFRPLIVGQTPCNHYVQSLMRERLDFGFYFAL